MAINFDPNGTITCDYTNTDTTIGHKICFTPSKGIEAAKFYINSNTTAPYFDPYGNVYCKNLVTNAVYHDGESLSNLCEAPYGSFASTILSGVTPTQEFMAQYPGSNPYMPIPAVATGYYYGNNAFITSPRGYIASNKSLTTLSAGTYIVKSGPNGVLINDVNYYNSSRGSYPIYRVGVFLCGGGGGGGAGRRIDSSTYGGGSGGGGGAKALVTLNLNSYEYQIIIGSGAAGATGSGYANDGDNSTISYRPINSSQSWLTFITCGGGKGGRSSSGTAVYAGGDGGTAYYSSQVWQVWTLEASTSGGKGGSGSKTTTGGDGADADGLSGYINGIENISASVTIGNGNGRPGGNYYGGGGGCYYSRGSYVGAGGNGGTVPSTGYSAGSGGSNGIGFIYY